jgi:hypothetical protein
LIGALRRHGPRRYVAACLHKSKTRDNNREKRHDAIAGESNQPRFAFLPDPAARWACIDSTKTMYLEMRVRPALRAATRIAASPAAGIIQLL